MPIILIKRAIKEIITLTPLFNDFIIKTTKRQKKRPMLFWSFFMVIINQTNEEANSTYSRPPLFFIVKYFCACTMIKNNTRIKNIRVPVKGGRYLSNDVGNDIYLSNVS